MYKIKRFSNDKKSAKDEIAAGAGLALGGGIALSGHKYMKKAAEFQSNADKMRIIGNVAAAKGDMTKAKTLVKSANLAEKGAQKLATHGKVNKMVGAGIAGTAALGYGAKKLHDKMKKSKE